MSRLWDWNVRDVDSRHPHYSGPVGWPRPREEVRKALEAASWVLVIIASGRKIRELQETEWGKWSIL
jgi:hypothetical protein